MIDATPLPAIVKTGEGFSTTCEHAKHCADELRHIRAKIQHAKQLMADRAYAESIGAVAHMYTDGLYHGAVTAISDVNAAIRAFIDGDYSIERSWQQICANAIEDFDGFVAAEGRVREFFESHLNFLRSLRDDPDVQAMEKDGLSFPTELDHAVEKTQEYRDRVLERWPLTRKELEYAFPVDVEEVVYIPPMAFLRSMVTIVWNAFRHPFSTTYVDLSTGKSVTLADEAKYEE